MADDPLLTIRQVKDLLQVADGTVRGYIRTGKLPAERLAGARLVRVRRSAVELLRVPIQPRKALEDNSQETR